MLTEMVEYGHKMEENVKTMQSEIKENAQGTNSEGKETGTQINDLEQKKEINNQNSQKTDLYGSPTTKNLKEKQSSRLVGGAEMGSQGGEGQPGRRGAAGAERTHVKAAAGGPG